MVCLPAENMCACVLHVGDQFECRLVLAPCSHVIDHPDAIRCANKGPSLPTRADLTLNRQWYPMLREHLPTFGLHLKSIQSCPYKATPNEDQHSLTKCSHKSTAPQHPVTSRPASKAALGHRQVSADKAEPGRHTIECSRNAPVHTPTCMYVVLIL